jgi:hypothetical protein
MRGVAGAAGGFPTGSGPHAAAACPVLKSGPDGAAGIAYRAVVAAVAHALLAGDRLLSKGKKVEGLARYRLEGVEVADSAAVRKGLRSGNVLFSGDPGGLEEKCGSQEKDQGGGFHSPVRLKM